MMGVFFLIHPKSGGEDDTAAIRPFWAMALIFKKTAKKKAPNQVLDDIRWLNPRTSPCISRPKNMKH